MAFTFVAFRKYLIIRWLKNFDFSTQAQSALLEMLSFTIWLEYRISLINEVDVNEWNEA